MKKILTFVAILFIGTSVFAQNNTPSETIKKEISILKSSDLNLSEVQLSRITTVLMGIEQNSLRTLKAAEGNKSLLEIRMKEVKEQKLNNVKGAMSAQQAQRFDALKLADKF
jgi:hypothetical protein